MNNSIKTTVLTILATVILAFIGAWIQINSRISVLEVQVQSDHDLFIVNQEKAFKNMGVLMNKINDIQIKVTQLSDLKQDKEFK